MARKILKTNVHLSGKIPDSNGIKTHENEQIRDIISGIFKTDVTGFQKTDNASGD